ncbi:hypothetical protein [Clostridium botulinum]|nr:hypothetical protein [Clostridium botulinum]APH21151.1 hypothetical protein NPD1_1316 [Clostridium botulinum]
MTIKSKIIKETKNISISDLKGVLIEVLSNLGKECVNDKDKSYVFKRRG